MRYRIRIVKLLDKSVSWRLFNNTYLSTYEVEDSQIAVLMAESILESLNDVIIKVSPVIIHMETESNISGILFYGMKLGVVVEGSELMNFQYE